MSNIQVTMRRILIFIVSGLLTFATGLMVTESWRQLSPFGVSLCTIARNPAVYEKREVRVTGKGSVLSSGLYENYLMVFDSSCPGFDTSTGVEFHASYIPDPAVEKFIEDPKQETREADVEIEGTITRIDSCFGPEFLITATSIKLLSPVRTGPFPQVYEQ
jgi:hypothetical protein